MKIFIGFLLLILLVTNLSLYGGYERLNKNSKAYYYTQSRPYWQGPTRAWDQNAYKSYFYYDHESYPQYTLCLSRSLLLLWLSLLLL